MFQISGSDADRIPLWGGNCASVMGIGDISVVLNRPTDLKAAPLGGSPVGWDAYCSRGVLRKIDGPLSPFLTRSKSGAHREKN